LKKDTFVEKSSQVTHFPFTLVMKSNSYDLIANSFEDFRDLTRGLQCLIDQRNNLPSIASRINIQNPIKSQFKDLSLNESQEGEEESLYEET